MNRAPQNPLESCLTPEQLVSLQTGEASGPEAAKLMAHVARCTNCAAILRISAADECPEPLPASRFDDPRARRALAARAAGVHPAWRTGFAIAASFAGIALIASFAWRQWRHSAESPEQLLAQVAQEHRPFDYRLPGLPWRAVDTRRGGDGSSTLAARESLGRIESMAETRLDAGVQLNWAKAALLHRKLDAAEVALERARGSAADSTEVDATAAVLEALRAEASGSADAMTRAVAAFDRILDKNPRDSITRYNRAILLMRLDQNARARGELGRLLASESDPNWRMEIELKLQDLSIR